MAIDIDTTSQKYQDYLTVLMNLKDDMLPRFKVFAKLSEPKRQWWLQHDPLMRKLVKLGIMMNKQFSLDSFAEDVAND